MNRLPLAVLISGSGTTLRNLLMRRDAGLAADFRVVISSRDGIAGLEIARQAKIPTAVIARKHCRSPEIHCQNVFDLCREHDVQLVVMAGYLEHLLIPVDFEHRVINIHPSLIPAFCGHGYYGLRVHQAVLDYGAKLTGCTVHFVDNEYDHGPIIAQRSCVVEPDDTAEELQRRVFQLECELLPEVIGQISSGRLSIVGRHVRLIDSQFQ